MSQESYVCCTTLMYKVQNRCFPYKIDFFYFKTSIITHDIDITEQNFNVSTPTFALLFGRRFLALTKAQFGKVPATR